MLVSRVYTVYSLWEALQFPAPNCAIVRHFARVFILSLALVVFVASSMASRQTNNYMEATFSALNVSSGSSSITSMSVIAMHYLICLLLLLQHSLAVHPWLTWVRALLLPLKLWP